MKTNNLQGLDIPELNTLSELWPCPDNLQPLAQQMLEGILSEHPSQESPTIIHLCGIPGSGKSTYARQLKQENADYYTLSFDQIMSELPGYRDDCITAGLKQAFARWELPARGLGYYFLKALLRAKRSILFDHSGANESHIILLRQIGKIAYRTELHYIPCDIETARLRVKERESQTQRHTPEHYLTERAALLENLLPKYRQVVHHYREAKPAKPEES